MLLIALCGLPGTGKSTLARRLAAELPAALLDKDVLRAALFAPEDVEHSAEQDDFCMHLLHETAGFLARRGRRPVALLDGRPHLRQRQVRDLREAARRHGLTLAFVLCTCPGALARSRLEADRAARSHPAADRGPALHSRLKAAAEPLEPPHLLLDTDALELDEQVRRVRAWIAPEGGGRLEPD